MTHHVLKIKKEYMDAKVRGDKLLEIRVNDREFQKGDTVSYVSDQVPTCEYPGLYEITYVTGFAQKPDWVVFGERLIKGATPEN